MGRGRKGEGSTADTARKRPERPWTAARTMEVLRRCPLAVAQRPVHCAFAVSAAVLGRVTTRTASTPGSLNMPDPIRIRYGSAQKHWPEAGRMILAHWLASGPDPFGPNLTQSARTKSDPGWFCTILFGTSAEGTEPNLKVGKLVAGRLRPARNRAL